MKKILFPTDFADHAPEWLNYALDIAAKFEATLVSIHVYNLPEEAFTTTEEGNELADFMLDTLKDFIQKYKAKKYDAVPLEFIVDTGLPEKEIVDVALDENIDLVIMGRTGKGEGTNNFFGRTSLGVIGKMDCPIIALPAEYDYSANDMAYLTDFHFRDVGALNVLREWAKVLETKVHCLHIYSPIQLELDALVNMSMLKDCYKGKSFAAFEVIEGELVEKTVQYIEGNNIGLIALLSKKRSFLQRIIEGSHARKIAKKINVPILIFKENAYKPVPFPIDFTKISIA